MRSKAKQTGIILATALITMVLTLALTSRIGKTIPGVFRIELVNTCQMDFFDTTVQPMRHVIYSCPRMDSIRLWPLPVLQPWYEDWYEYYAPGSIEAQKKPLGGSLSHSGEYWYKTVQKKPKRLSWSLQEAF